MSSYILQIDGTVDSEFSMIMAVRRIMEPVTRTESSGYGFPFSLRYLNFFLACQNMERKISMLSEKLTHDVSKSIASNVLSLISKITRNEGIKRMANKLSHVNSLFQRLRLEFGIQKKGKLSEDLPSDSDDIVHERVNTFMGQMDVYLHADIPAFLIGCIKTMIGKYRHREKLLFANNPDHTIPRTNNGMERLFRRVRRNVRKRCGNIATGNILAQSGSSLLLFQNMANEKYRIIVFGSGDNSVISEIFGRHRRPFSKKGMTRKRANKLVDEATAMLINGTLADTPYTDELMEKARLSTG